MGFINTVDNLNHFMVVNGSKKQQHHWPHIVALNGDFYIDLVVDEC